jgi:hypothetical protein
MYAKSGKAMITNTRTRRDRLGEAVMCFHYTAAKLAVLVAVDMRKESVEELGRYYPTTTRSGH